MSVVKLMFPELKVLALSIDNAGKNRFEKDMVN